MGHCSRAFRGGSGLSSASRSWPRASVALRCAIDETGNRARVSAKSSKAPAFFTATASETRSPLSRRPSSAARAPRAQQPAARHHEGHDEEVC